MIKKIKRFIGDLWEKIFKRMELHNIKLESSFLKDRLNEATTQIEKGSEIMNLLTSGEEVKLTQSEKVMILTATEFPAFRGWIEFPATRAHDRITWRDLREKIKLHLKADHEEKEDDGTKEA